MISVVVVLCVPVDNCISSMNTNVTSLQILTLDWNYENNVNIFVL